MSNLRDLLVDDPASQLHADEIFSERSTPMVAAVRAASQILRGEIPDDELKDTDAALAAEFSVDHADRLQFDYRRGAWMVCKNGIWCEDGSNEALRTLQGWAESRVFDHVTRAATMRDMDAVRRASRRALAAHSLKRLLELAAAQALLANPGDEWDRNPWLLTTPDGTAIDLKTGGTRAARSGDRVTLACGVPWDASARCDSFRAFVLAICDDDAELVSLVQKAAGYSATGDTSEQKFNLLIGTGANGKTTLLEILAYVFGAYAATVPFSALVRERDVRSVPVEIARLPGKRFCRASELREGATLDEGRIKSLTGDDTLMARNLYASPFEFKACVKLWLACNKLPRVDDRSHAFWRRAVVIPFRRTFDGSARDNSLPARLREEGPGILNWIVEGALAWQRDGLPYVASVETARNDWRASQDVIAQWADLALEVSENGRLKASEAYHAFAEWATSEGLSEKERPGRRTFGEWMRDHFTRDERSAGNTYRAEVRRPSVEGVEGVEPFGESVTTRARKGTSAKEPLTLLPSTDIGRTAA